MTNANANATSTVPDIGSIMDGIEAADAEQAAAFKTLDADFEARRAEIYEEQKRLNRKSSGLESAYYTARDVVNQRRTKAVQALAA